MDTDWKYYPEDFDDGDEGGDIESPSNNVEEVWIDRFNTDLNGWVTSALAFGLFFGSLFSIVTLSLVYFWVESLVYAGIIAFILIHFVNSFFLMWASPSSNEDIPIDVPRERIRAAVEEYQAEIEEENE